MQKAQADKLAETPEFAKKLAYLRDKALMETLLGKVAKDAATDAAIKQTYDERREEPEARNRISRAPYPRARPKTRRRPR